MWADIGDGAGVTITLGMATVAGVAKGDSAVAGAVASAGGGVVGRVVTGTCRPTEAGARALSRVARAATRVATAADLAEGAAAATLVVVVTNVSRAAERFRVRASEKVGRKGRGEVGQAAGQDGAKGGNEADIWKPRPAYPDT